MGDPRATNPAWQCRSGISVVWSQHHFSPPGCWWEIGGGERESPLSLGGSFGESETGPMQL